MRNCICVDYLSFEWTSEDLVVAFKELRKDKSKTLYDLLTQSKTKRLHNKRNKQIRYENILWRQMAKSCTKNLSYSNSLVNPNSLNWQKESDITWLYGPLYVSHDKSTSSDSVYDWRHWSKTRSESGKQSVRFNPDIIEIQYLPETPIAENLIKHQQQYIIQKSSNLKLIQFCISIVSFTTWYLYQIISSAVLNHVYPKNKKLSF